MIKKLSLLSFALLFCSTTLSAATPKTVKKITWIVAHNPTNTALNKMITDAGKAIEKKTKGSVKMDYVFYDNKVRARHGTALTAVVENKAQIAQVELSIFNKNSPEIDVFNMPYLLNSHDQVKKIISGTLGEKMKQAIVNGTKGTIQPIAFTYSGGFRMFYGNKALRSLADFKGLRTTNQGIKPIVEYHQMLGMVVDKDGSSREEAYLKHKNNQIDVEDSELNRLYVLSQDYPDILKSVKYVTETRHLFYLTMIVMNAEFLNGLTPAEKKVVTTELEKLAEVERVYSIKQEEVAKTYLKSKGVEFIEMTPENKEAFVKVSQKLWYTHSLGALIKEVQAIK